MATTEKRVFVYGDFNVPTSVPTQRGLAKIGRTQPVEPPYAIEILREFSGSEFVGKVYQRTPSSQWSLLRPGDATSALWYQVAMKNPKALKFKMEGSGEWGVQNLRAESDEQGPYVAVALSKK